MLFAPFLTCPLRGAWGVGRGVSVKVRFSLTLVFGFVCLLLCATRWRKKEKHLDIGRGPLEQRIMDFFHSVP